MFNLHKEVHTSLQIMIRKYLTHDILMMCVKRKCILHVHAILRLKFLKEQRDNENNYVQNVLEFIHWIRNHPLFMDQLAFNTLHNSHTRQNHFSNEKKKV